MKAVRVTKIVSAEGNARHDVITATLKGDCGFSAKIKFRTSDTASLALELGGQYQLNLTEIGPETGKEVQTADAA